MRCFIIMESLIKYYPTIQRFLSLCIALCMSDLLWPFLSSVLDIKGFIIIIKLLLYNNYYYYRSVPCKCPCTGFHGVNVIASIQMYGIYIPGKCPCGHWSTNRHLPVNVHCILHSSKVPISAPMLGPHGHLPGISIPECTLHIT